MKEARYLINSIRKINQRLKDIFVLDEEEEYEEGEYEAIMEVIEEEVDDLTRRRRDLYEQCEELLT